MVGPLVGEVVGCGVVGKGVGESVGEGEGSFVGEGDGEFVGPSVGEGEGEKVGSGSQQLQFSPSQQGTFGAKHWVHAEQLRHSRLVGRQGSIPDQEYFTDPKMEGLKIGTSPARMTTSLSSFIHGIVIISYAAPPTTLEIS